jgi:predicted nucleotidyltransferase
MTPAELGPNKRAAILAIAARHGVQRVRVFGSFARGDAPEDTDLDLLIEAGPRTPPWFPGGLLVDLEEELGGRVDVAEEVLFILSSAIARFMRRFPCEGRIGKISSRLIS